MPEVLAPPVAPTVWLGLSDDTPDAERQALSTAVDLAARLTASRRVSLLLPAEAGDTLRVAAASGLAAPLAERVRVRLGDPVAGLVALNRRPLLINEPRVRPDHQARGYQTGAYISVPVPLDGDACGVLNVADPQRPEGFESRDLQALEALAQQVTKNLRFQQLSRRAATLEETVQQLRRQVIRVQEAERQRIARDLHDDAGHALTATILRLDLDLMQLADDDPAAETLRRAREQLVECTNTLHDIAFNLRPRILEDFGLHAALRSLARHTMELTDLDVTFALSGLSWTLDELQELAILRVVQEGLTNVRKYAQASQVRIALRYEPERLTLEVEDDGIGLHERGTAPLTDTSRVSLGIGGMRERIELLDGTFSIGPGPMGGTRIVAQLPR